jgi:hypothetical protein
MVVAVDTVYNVRLSKVISEGPFFSSYSKFLVPSFESFPNLEIPLLIRPTVL